MKRYTTRSTRVVGEDPARIVRDAGHTPNSVIVVDIEMLEDSNGDWVKYKDIVEEYGEHGELCACCKKVGLDRRTLFMACGYEMNELDIPFKMHDSPTLPGFNRRQLYTLLVCKKCRGKWMDAIKEWFDEGED